ncbi:MAG: Holliday junction branch migration protein RuvA [Candidatus Wildermuthbacteria bacterium]|nr:Holliday junction branch migration protein RuvA [Candidatus Wildermuthbacteria bacterium]
MISYLKGKVLAQSPDSFILEAGGVGYKVFVGQSLLSSLVPGQAAEVFCHLHVKQQETLELYGVSSAEALTLFESLLSVSGIGPKAALAISSLGSAQDLQKAIKDGDERFFAGVHGVGKKKIQKIILELAGKITTGSQKEKVQDQDALDALITLGFSRQQAKGALSKVSSGAQDTSKRVQEALRVLGKAA